MVHIPSSLRQFADNRAAIAVNVAMSIRELFAYFEIEFVGRFLIRWTFKKDTIYNKVR